MTETPRFASVDFPPVLEETLGAGWPLGRAAQYTVLRHFRELLEQREAVWANEEVEAVHRIRVAARRTRTALQTFASIWPQRQAKAHLEALTDLADTFTASRDLDVMILYLRAGLEHATPERRRAMEWLLKRSEDLRALEQPKLEAVLLEFERRGMPGKIARFFSTTPVDLWPKTAATVEPVEDSNGQG